MLRSQSANGSQKNNKLYKENMTDFISERQSLKMEMMDCNTMKYFGQANQLEGMKSSSQYEGGIQQQYPVDQSILKEQEKTYGLLFNALAKVKFQAQMLQDKRKLDPNRYKHVKSKVSKNIKVINKNQIKQKFDQLKRDDQFDIAQMKMNKNQIKQKFDQLKKDEQNDIAQMKINKNDPQFYKDRENYCKYGDKGVEIFEKRQREREEIFIILKNKLSKSVLKSHTKKIDEKVPEQKSSKRAFSVLKQRVSPLKHSEMTFAKEKIQNIYKSKQSQSLRNVNTTKASQLKQSRSALNYMKPTFSKLNKEQYGAIRAIETRKSSKDKSSIQINDQRQNQIFESQNKIKQSAETPYFPKGIKTTKSYVEDNEDEQLTIQIKEQKLSEIDIVKQSDLKTNDNSSVQVSTAAKNQYQNNLEFQQSFSPEIHKKILKSEGAVGKSKLSNGKFYQPNQDYITFQNPSKSQNQNSEKDGPYEQINIVTVQNQKHNFKQHKVNNIVSNNIQELKFKNSQMQEQFQEMLLDLQNERKNKNYDFYDQHVADEYTKEENNNSKTKNLIIKKKNTLKDQLQGNRLYAKKEEADPVQAVQTGAVLKKGNIQIDRRLSKMAQKNPLDFIEEVLAQNNNSNKLN